MMHPTPPPVLSQRTTQNHQNHHQQHYPTRYSYNNNHFSENDAISLNGSTIHSPLRTHHPSAQHDIPLFQNPHRRKGRHRSMNDDDHNNSAATSLVQNAMKLILLSPVLVLVIWSVTAITWTNQQMKLQQQQQQLQAPATSSGGYHPPRASTRRQQQRQTTQSWSFIPFRNRRTGLASPPQQQQQQQLPPPQQQQIFVEPPAQQAALIVQPSFLIPPKQQQQQTQQQQLKEEEEAPISGSTEDYYQDPIPIGMRPQQQEPQPLQVVVMNPEMASSSSKNYHYSFPEQQSTGNKQFYYTFPEQQQQQPAAADTTKAAATNSIAVYDPKTGRTQYYYSFPEQQQETSRSDSEPLPIVMDTASDKVLVPHEPLPPLTLQQQPMSSLSLRSSSSQGTVKDDHHHFLRHDTQNKNHHSSSTHNNVKYYFYDPRDIKNDQHHSHGHVHLPQYVYDSFGRLIPFKSLASSSLNKLPLVTMIHPNSTVLNATAYNFTHTHPPVVETRQKRKMSFPSDPKQYLTNWTTSTILHYNENHASPTSSMADSSIIICTVGVMALLVGALSARRMRSHQQRSILSMCIENEQLDHDAAVYDTMNTTTNPNNAIFGSNHYNTFAQGWKGDLEKFDV